jgi:hypothetical protein
VLHVTPESAVGGPLALVRDGDLIRLDVESRRLDLAVDDAELAARRDAWTPPARTDERGFRRLHVDHVLQSEPRLRLRLPPWALGRRRGRGHVSVVPPLVVVALTTPFRPDGGVDAVALGRHVAMLADQASMP